MAVRTGDTPARERRLQARDPAEILVTTPESLYLILGSKQRETLRTVETVIVDEIHALARDKRGSHLALTLERLDALCEEHPVRIGLSATQRPIETVAQLLVGAGEGARQEKVKTEEEKEKEKEKESLEKVLTGQTADGRSVGSRPSRVSTSPRESSTIELAE